MEGKNNDNNLLVDVLIFVSKGLVWVSDRSTCCKVSGQTDY